MKERLRLKIITPQKVVFDKDVDELVVPGKEGDFGVLYGHTPFLTSIRPGTILIRIGNDYDYFSIHDGFAEVDIDKLNIVSETIEHVSEIDKGRAERAKQRAERRLKEKGDIDFRRAEAALHRAIARIKTIELSKELRVGS